MTNPPRLCTIGHSNHAVATFLGLLAGAGVAAVADVRSSPCSRRLPWFNRAELREELRRQGLAYVFLGDLLGGRPRDPALYDDDGRADYERMRQAPAFRKGLERLVRGAVRFPVALLCSEEDPLDCHRGLLIGPALREEYDLAPIHLRGDGREESTDEMEERLLEITGVAEELRGHLFAHLLTRADRREDLAEAYRRRARQKAYRRPS